MFEIGDHVEIIELLDMARFDSLCHRSKIGSRGVVKQHNSGYDYTQIEFDGDERHFGTYWVPDEYLRLCDEAFEGETTVTSEGKMNGATVTAGKVDVVREGMKLIIPDGMSYADAREWLTRKEKDEESPVNFYSEIKGYFPLDAAVAFSRTLAKMYDWVDTAPSGFFGPTPPTMLRIMTGINVAGKEVYTEVPWGRFAIPGVAGYLTLDLKFGSEPCLVINGSTKKKCVGIFDRIAEETKKTLATNSIYRAQSVRVSWDWQRADLDFDPSTHAPKYLNLANAREESLIFSDSVMRTLQLGLFTPIEQAVACRKAQIPLKRGVILEGPYGTGKTLTALVTALKANRYGWTFVYCDNIFDLSEGLRFAAMYEPAIVFVEDVDKAIADRNVNTNELLNILDGIDTKHNEVITVFTTNFVDNLDKAFLRPGRLDTVVSVRPPDADAAARLVQQYSRGLLAFDADYKAIGHTLAGQIPAVIREVVERAKIAAIHRLSGFGNWDGSIDGEVEENDIRTAQQDMMGHIELCKEKPKQLPHITSINLHSDHFAESGRHVALPHPLDGMASATELTGITEDTFKEIERH